MAHSISDADIRALSRTLEQKDAKIDKLKGDTVKAGAVSSMLALGEAIGGAGAFGYLRGQMEDQSTGAWNLPGTTVDIEALVVAGLAAVALGGGYIKALKPYSKHAAFIAAGIGGHYAGQLGRKMGRTGKFSMVAGVPGIGALPQYAPPGYSSTQFSDPYADPVAASLASAGV